MKFNVVAGVVVDVVMVVVVGVGVAVEDLTEILLIMKIQLPATMGTLEGIELQKMWRLGRLVKGVDMVVLVEVFVGVAVVVLVMGKLQMVSLENALLGGYLIAVVVLGVGE